MKKKTIYLICLVLIAHCFSGCVVASISNVNAVRGTGELEKYDFRVGEFNSIVADGYFKINYHSAYSDTVTLEIQPNLLEHFEIKNEDGCLTIKTLRVIRTDSEKTPVLTVSTPLLNELVIKGVSEIRTHDTINADSFALVLSGVASGSMDFNVENINANVSGAGSLELSGNADKADFYMAGAASLDALALQTREAKIIMSGAGSIKVSCSENLSILASGAGSIEYRGSPVIDMNNTGVVSIRKIN